MRCKVLVRFGKGFIETYLPKGEHGAMSPLHANHDEPIRR